MGNIQLATLLGTLAGVLGTGLGAVLSGLFRIRSGRAMSFVLEFAAGLMLAVACLELLPEAFLYGAPIVAVGGVLAGIVMAMAVQNIVKYGRRAKKRGTGSLRATGIIAAIGVAAHNLPEGLAIGSGLSASMAMGLSLALVIVVHDVPEGMAMATPMLGSGMKLGRVIGLTMLTGLPTGLGALAGAAVGGLSESVVGFCLALAGGTMLYIALGDLIPEAGRAVGGRLPAMGAVMGVLFGFFVTGL